MNKDVFDDLCPVNQSGAVCYYPPGSQDLVDLVTSARKRPGMYVGSVGPSGVHCMAFDVLDTLIYLSPSFQHTEISVEFSENWIAFRSNQLTTRESAGWERLCLPVAAALSQRFQLFLTMRNHRICRSFEKGLFTEETRHPLLENQLIEVRFWPDSEIFPDRKVDYFSLYDRCYTLATLYPGLTIRLHGQSQHNHFCFPEGMGRLLTSFGPGSSGSAHEDILTFEREADDVLVRGAIRRSGFPGKSLSYANGYPTPDGGTHVEGLRQGIRQSLIKSGGKTYKDLDDHVRSGYEFAIAVWLDHPSYAGSVKRMLQNGELIRIVADAVDEIWSETQWRQY